MAMIISFQTFAETGLIVRTDGNSVEKKSKPYLSDHRIAKLEALGSFDGISDDELTDIIYGDDVFDSLFNE